MGKQIVFFYIQYWEDIMKRLYDLGIIDAKAAYEAINRLIGPMM